MLQEVGAGLLGEAIAAHRLPFEAACIEAGAGIRLNLKRHVGAASQECIGMKVKIDIDCTPEEARAFFGLPDLGPLHEQMTAMLG